MPEPIVIIAAVFFIGFAVINYLSQRRERRERHRRESMRWHIENRLRKEE